jgi:aminopeptidase YwaD
VDCPRFSVHAPDGAPVAFVLAAPFGQARPLPNPRPLLVTPTVVISAEEGEELRAALTDTSRVIEARVLSPSVREDALTSANLIADLGAAGRRLAVVAHYDSVPGSPGANDNASGVAVLLRLVERFRERLRGPIGLRFLFSGAEEPFLVGARAYVADLAASRELGELVACLNLDMLGVGDAFQIRCVEGSLWARVAGSIGDHSPSGLAIGRVGAMPSSDHWAFHEAGIASAQLTRVPDPAWHTPDDVPARFTAADLDEAEGVAHALVAAALEALSQAALPQPDGVV